MYVWGIWDSCTILGISCICLVSNGINLRVLFSCSGIVWYFLVYGILWYPSEYYCDYICSVLVFLLVLIFCFVQFVCIWGNSDNFSTIGILLIMILVLIPYV